MADTEFVVACHIVVGPEKMDACAEALGEYTGIEDVLGAQLGELECAWDLVDVDHVVLEPDLQGETEYIDTLFQYAEPGSLLLIYSNGGTAQLIYVPAEGNKVIYRNDRDEIAALLKQWILS
jgi:hypothetical protein